MKNLISRKTKQVVFCLGLVLCIVPSLSVNADESDEANLNQKIQVFQSQLDTELTKVNEVYAKAQSAQKEVQLVKEKINTTNSKIKQTQEEITHLRDRVGHQLRSLQSEGGTFTSVVGIVASSANFTDMVRRLTNFNFILSAESKQAETLIEKEKSLKALTEDLEESKVQLTTDQKEYDSQLADLEGNISNLKNKVTSNQSLLAEMEARAAAEKAKTDNLDITKSPTNTASNAGKNNSSSGQNSNNNAPSQPVISNTGRQMTVSATAYALNGITAIGIDLSKNPMCIAVDPTVIPLGSMLEVPGYGIAIAGDTGGGIKGNKIDVHFPTVNEATNWGVQTKVINILS